MLSNKKAVAMGQLVIIVITVVGFLLLLGTINRVLAKSQDKEAEYLCHNSIALRMATTVNVEDVDMAISPVLCKTIDKKIRGDREEIKEQMAYMMARCWWMFNEGRQDDLLDAVKVSSLLGWDNSGNSCFLCYTGVIDEKEIPGGPIGAQEMFTYLQQTDHRQFKGMKYLDYIQSYGGPGKAAVMDSISPKNAYGVVFMSKSDDDASMGWIDAVVGGLAAAGVVVCAIAEPCGIIAGAVAVAGTSYVAAHSANVLAAKANFYEEERSVSMVTLDDLKGVEAGDCLVKDIAGN
jgi:hypothetical protein